jgi:4-hydroxy-3-methylbut-2-enyl diphosphate reductase IspH
VGTGAARATENGPTTYAAYAALDGDAEQFGSVVIGSVTQTNITQLVEIATDAVAAAKRVAKNVKIRGVWLRTKGHPADTAGCCRFHNPDFLLKFKPLPL